MDDTPRPSSERPVLLPPPGGKLGRILLAVVFGLVGLLQVVVGIQAERTPTVVIGTVILMLAISLSRRVDRAVSIGAGGVSIPGWPRGADIAWSQVGRLIVHQLPLGVVRLRLGRDDVPAGTPPKTLATLSAAQAAQLLPRVRALAEARQVPVVSPDGDALPEGDA